MRPNQLALIALTLAITLLTGCSKSSTTSATTVVATFTATDTATVQAPGSASGSFAFLGAASAVSGIPSTVTIGLNPAGLPLTAAVSGVVAITAPSLTSGTIAYSGNTPFTPTTTGTTNFMGDLYASVVPATLADTLAGLRYSNFGEWQLLPPPGLTDTYYVQEYAGGTQITPTSGVPATGTYAGTEAAIGFVGTATAPYSPDEYIISAGGTDVSLIFASPNTFTGTIAYISGTRDRWTGAVSGAFNLLALSGTVSGNIFTGSVTTVAGPSIDITNPLALPASTPGTVSGMFYGPAGNEVSGVYQLTATTSNGPVIIIGSFGAKQ